MAKDYTMMVEFISAKEEKEKAKVTFFPPPFKDGDTIRFDANDTITPAYHNPPGTVVNSVMIVSTDKHGTDSLPFTHLGNQIDLLHHSTLKISNETGRWCFAMILAVRSTNNVTSFYYVPDPELQVGSIGGGNPPCTHLAA